MGFFGLQAQPNLNLPTVSAKKCLDHPSVGYMQTGGHGRMCMDRTA